MLLVRRRVLQRDPGENRIELFGHDHSDGGVDPLPHLDLRHYQRDLSVAINADKGIWRKIGAA